MKEFNIDIEATEKYRSMYNELCDCIYCKNFYKSLPIYRPDIIEFIESFGLNYKYALDVMDFGKDDNNNVDYYVYYSVKGTMEKKNLILI